MNSFRIWKTIALVMILAIIPLSISAAASSSSSLSCGISSSELFEIEELSTVSMKTLEYEFNEAKGHLAQGKCSELKPDYCSMGACKDGWKCKANVNSCMCFPPN